MMMHHQPCVSLAAIPQDLRRANFTSANIRNANFKGAKLQGAYFIKAVAPKVRLSRVTRHISVPSTATAHVSGTSSLPGFCARDHGGLLGVPRRGALPAEDAALLPPAPQPHGTRRGAVPVPQAPPASHGILNLNPEP
jgi:hypothetical protein